MKTFKASKFIEAYKEGKPNLKMLKPTGKQSGVYYIKNPNTGKVVYIGFSGSSLYKTIYRHFQKWNDTQQDRKIFKPNFLVRVIFCTPERASRIEKFLIKKLNPKDNVENYASFELSKKEIEEGNEFFKNLTPIDNEPF